MEWLKIHIQSTEIMNMEMLQAFPLRLMHGTWNVLSYSCSSNSLEILWIPNNQSRSKQ